MFFKKKERKLNYEKMLRGKFSIYVFVIVVLMFLDTFYGVDIISYITSDYITNSELMYFYLPIYILIGLILWAFDVTKYTE